MIYNWAGNREWIEKHDNGDIGEGLRLSQYWVMYARVSPVTATSQLIGRTSDSRQIDLYHYIKTKGEEVEALPENTIVQDMTDRFPSPRWERAISQWSNAHNRRDGARAQQLCRALCNLLNEDALSPKFLSVEFRSNSLHILPPGSKFRFAEQLGGQMIKNVPSFVVDC